MPAPSPASSNLQTFVATSRQVACTVGGEAVILHLDEGLYYSLNPVGTCIWALLQQPRSKEELIARVLEEFDVTPERCRADVEELLEALCTRLLVVPAEVSG